MRERRTARRAQRQAGGFILALAMALAGLSFLLGRIWNDRPDCAGVLVFIAAALCAAWVVLAWVAGQWAMGKEVI